MSYTPKKIQYKVVAPAQVFTALNPFPEVLLKSLKRLDYVIYGGYVRDLIAKKYNPNFSDGFKDIDILLLPVSHSKFIKNLEENGYEVDHSESSEWRYLHWGAVSRVVTLVAKNPNKNLPRIQAARTIVNESFYNIKSKDKATEKLRDTLLEPVLAVDLVCCSLAITPNGKLIEVLGGAFNDAKNLILRESRLAAHKDNIKERIEKLSKRGWKLK